MAARHQFGDRTSPVSPLNREALVAQLFGHQFVEQVAEAKCQRWLVRLIRKAEARETWHDNVKRGLAARRMSRRIGKQGNHLEKTRECIGSAMQQEKWNRILTMAFF